MPSGDPDQTGETAAKPLSVAAHLQATLALAVPAVLARSGLLLMMATDTLMVGQHHPEELAYLGLAMSLQAILIAISVGVLQGQLVITAQAYGAGRFLACGRIWRVGLLHAAVLGLVMGVATTQADRLLLLAGQSDAVVAGAHEVLIHVAWGQAGTLLYLACAYFLEGIQRPRAAVIVMALAVFANIGLNLLVIGPDSGGAAEALMTTSLARWLTFGALLIYLLVLSDRHKFGLFAAVGDAINAEGRRLGAAVRRIGFPVAIGFGLETGAMAALTLMAGAIGKLELAAFHVTTQLLQVTYMIAIGTAAATAVRVGAFYGRDDWHGLARAAWTGIGVGLGLMGSCALLFWVMPETFAGLFIAPDATLLTALTIGLILVAGFQLIANAATVVVMGALRGTGDVLVPLIVQMAGIWLISLPLGAALAFGTGLGAQGLLIGATAGITAGGLVLGYRLNAMIRRSAPAPARGTPL